jgi:hypothetical protein
MTTPVPRAGNDSYLPVELHISGSPWRRLLIHKCTVDHLQRRHTFVKPFRFSSALQEGASTVGIDYLSPAQLWQ